MADQQLIGALEAGGTKMVCATGYADGTVLEREQIATTTPQETVEAVNAWFANKGIAALGIGAFGPTAVEHHFRNTFSNCTFSNKFADNNGLFSFSSF